MFSFAREYYSFFYNTLNCTELPCSQTFFDSEPRYILKLFLSDKYEHPFKAEKKIKLNSTLLPNTHENENV